MSCSFSAARAAATWSGTCAHACRPRRTARARLPRGRQRAWPGSAAQAGRQWHPCAAGRGRTSLASVRMCFPAARAASTSVLRAQAAHTLCTPRVCLAAVTAAHKVQGVPVHVGPGAHDDCIDVGVGHELGPVIVCLQRVPQRQPSQRWPVNPAQGVTLQPSMPSAALRALSTVLLQTATICAPAFCRLGMCSFFVLPPAPALACVPSGGLSCAGLRPPGPTSACAPTMPTLTVAIVRSGMACPAHVPSGAVTRPRGRRSCAHAPTAATPAIGFDRQFRGGSAARQSRAHARLLPVKALPGPSAPLRGVPGSPRFWSFQTALPGLQQ